MYGSPLQFAFLEVFYHRQKVVNVAIIAELFCSLVEVAENDFKLA